VVPTYNYVVVHAHGPVEVFDDAARLRALVTRLTQKFEGSGRDAWKVTDAPSDFIDNQLKAIVGIEIRVARLLGKSKASQNRSERDQTGVIRGLRERDERDGMASWMEEYLPSRKS
jgi:transcriptional regulator